MKNYLNLTPNKEIKRNNIKNKTPPPSRNSKIRHINSKYSQDLENSNIDLKIKSNKSNL